MHKVSPTHSRIAGRQAAGNTLALTKVTDQAIAGLRSIGLVFSRDIVSQQVQALFNGELAGRAEDAAFTAPITTPSIPTPVQFLQAWLPGFVKVMTAARKIDEIIGINTVGSWEDEEIVQGIVEPSGTATEYGDLTNIPLTSWNANFERRTIVRGEMGLSVGILEEGRASKMRIASSEQKRQQAAVALEIMRNAIGFFGWQTNGNRTFGFLNDPNLPAFQSAPSAAAGGWAQGDFQDITGDIRFAVRRLRIQSQDQVDPSKVNLTLAIPTDKVDYLSVTTDFGISVSDWITQTYPKMRVVSAPELAGATIPEAVALDVLYLFADDIESSVDGSTDGGETFIQLVQSKFITLGVEKRAKVYVEDYSNGTAGALCKRPWAVVRLMGI